MQLMKWGLKPRSRKLIACMVALIILFSMMGLGSPDLALANTEMGYTTEGEITEINPETVTFAGDEWTIAAVEEEPAEPETAEVEYPAEGEITEINPDTVTYADGKFTVPADVTEFTFKDNGIAIKATFADEKWAIAAVEEEPAEPETVEVEYPAEGEITEINPDTVTYADEEWTIAAVEEEPAEPETVEVEYPAEGEITEINPDTVTYADGKFTVPADVTEFTFKDGDKEMKATFANDTWSFAKIIPATTPLYTLTPVEDAVYTVATSDGRSTMTVKAGKSGFNFFAVSVEPVMPHKGNETVIFTHWRGETELQLNATMADFDDVANTAQAGFNVQSGDVIKVCIVDRLTNDSNINPVVFQ